LTNQFRCKQRKKAVNGLNGCNGYNPLNPLHPLTAIFNAMTTKIPHQDLTYEIIGAAMEVHSEIGPGYNEEIYQKSLEIEFRNRKVQFEPQKSVEVEFKGEMVGLKLLDFLVDNKIVVEIKALSRLDSIHEAQLISYLKATGSKIGLLINFGAKKLEYKRILPPVKVREWKGQNGGQLASQQIKRIERI